MQDFSHYFTVIPLLFAAQMSLVWIAARRAAQAGRLEHPGWIAALIWLLVLWGGVTTWLGATGVFLTPGVLAAYPTFWLPFLPVVIVLIPAMASRRARHALQQLIDATPASGLIGIHILRILAIGTAIKAWTGEFSHAFEIWVGLPDLAFGLSALWMLRRARRGRISRPGLLAWNMAGVLVILPGAPIVAQRELPGALFVAEQVPPMTTLYEFPMVLAPALVVPVFVMFNLFVALRLLGQALAGDR